MDGRTSESSKACLDFGINEVSEDSLANNSFVVLLRQPSAALLHRFPVHLHHPISPADIVLGLAILCGTLMADINLLPSAALPSLWLLPLGIKSTKITSYSISYHLTRIFSHFLERGKRP